MCPRKETMNLNFVENLVCLRVYPSVYEQFAKFGSNLRNVNYFSKTPHLRCLTWFSIRNYVLKRTLSCTLSGAVSTLKITFCYYMFFRNTHTFANILKMFLFNYFP